jgi:parvulin-like peptidyl-prolyl isomerase
MIAKDGGGSRRLFRCVVVAGVILSAGSANAQQDIDQRFNVPPAPPAANGHSPNAPPEAGRTVNLRDIKGVPPLVQTRVAVNPGDAIAVVNGQTITRAQLADECVARKGKEILEMLINRTIIEQQLRAQKKSVTAAEIDEEIDSVARRFGIDRMNWLKNLEKEKGISPSQYARDIIYPALALRKLCAGRVQVSDKDIKDAFQSQYGDKIRCRMIMVDKQIKAVAIWEELRKNPAAFEKMAQEQSMDPASRAMGGLLTEPITRHAYPKHVADAAFRQLVDGDLGDRNVSNKPKNGSITGPIQYTEAVWVILRREELIPGNDKVTLDDPLVRKQVEEMIYQVKLTETMKTVFEELYRTSGIQNNLVGSVKIANEEKDPDYAVDNKVKLMGGQQPDANGPAGRSPVPGGSTRLPTPAALSPEVSDQFKSLDRPLKPGGNPAPSDQ